MDSVVMNELNLKLQSKDNFICELMTASALSEEVFMEDLQTDLPAEREQVHKQLHLLLLTLLIKRLQTSETASTV